MSLSSILLRSLLSGLLASSLVSPAFADDFKWPDGIRAAVNLAYDDALASQLDNAIPALNRHGFKGSFYVTIASDVLHERLAEWRAAAANGHELGNHTIFHQCSASGPGREWVDPVYDLNKSSLQQHVDQIRIASRFLHAIDGKSERTFTTPCGDVMIGQDNYVEAIRQDFVAIKSRFSGIETDMKAVDPAYVSVLVPFDVSGEQLIALVKEAAKAGSMIHFTFHGIGGDHLSISNEAHETLLRYLADNRDTYWVDTFLNIMKYVRQQNGN